MNALAVPMSCAVQVATCEDSFGSYDVTMYSPWVILPILALLGVAIAAVVAIRRRRRRR